MVPLLTLRYINVIKRNLLAAVMRKPEADLASGSGVSPTMNVGPHLYFLSIASALVLEAPSCICQMKVFWSYCWLVSAVLKPIDSRQRQHPLKDRSQANQHHEDFEKIC